MFLPILVLLGLATVSAVAGVLATSPSARGRVAGALSSYGNSRPRTKVVTTRTTARGKGKRAVQRTRTVAKPKGRVSRAAAKAASTWFEPPADGKNDPDKPTRKATVPPPRPSGSATTPMKGNPVSTSTTSKPAAKTGGGRVPRSRAKASTPPPTRSKGTTSGRGSSVGSAKESLPALKHFLKETPGRLEDADLVHLLEELETIGDLDGFDPGRDVRAALEEVASEARAARDLVRKLQVAVGHAHDEVSKVHAVATEMPGDASGDLTKFNQE